MVKAFYVFVMVVAGSILLSTCLTNMHRLAKLNDKFNMGFLEMKVFQNSILNVTAIRSFTTTEGTASCLTECIKQVTPIACLSVNMKTIQGNQSECALLATDKYHSYNAFKSISGSSHYAIKTKCSEDPCHGETCIPFYHNDTYKCTSKLLKNGTAVQSSTYGSASPQLAHDGKYSQIAEIRPVVYCSHAADNPSWWKLTLEFEAKIVAIEIYNRLDCCTERMSHSTIHILATSGKAQYCGELGNMYNIDIKKVECGEVLQGNALKITTPNFLNFCEIDIYGVVV